MGPMRLLAAAALIAVAVAASGCGSGGSSGDSGLRAAIDTVPGDQSVNAVDVAAVREQLGLPDDAGSLRPARSDDDELQLMIVSATALPFLSTRDPALTKSLDFGDLRQAATGGLSTETQVTALRFDGAAGDVLQNLARAGWRRRGQLFESPRGRGTARFAGQGKDELVLLSSSAKALNRARMGKAPDGPARDLVRSLDQPVRTGAAFGGSGCLAAVGGGDDVEPPRGQLVAVPKAKPEKARLAQGRKIGRVRLAAPAIDGDRVTADFTGAAKRSRGQVAVSFLQRFQFNDVYECPR